VSATFAPQGPTGATGPAGGISAGNTADTFEPYKVILLAQGNAVKAIPASADAPALPTGLAVIAKLSSVRIHWTAAARASQYRLFKDGVLLTTTSGLSYRDRAIAVSHTYQYVVQAVDGYGQRSQPTAPVSAFIDPALNVAPVVDDVVSWPPVVPSSGRSILRVNAHDANAHALALALGVSAGSIAATDDPSVWIYTP
jgi:hypothetical protein